MVLCSSLDDILYLLRNSGHFNYFGETKMKQFLIRFLWTQLYFTAIVFCEIIKWWAAGKLQFLIPWLKH